MSSPRTWRIQAVAGGTEVSVSWNSREWRFQPGGQSVVSEFVGSNVIVSGRCTQWGGICGQFWTSDMLTPVGTSSPEKVPADGKDLVDETRTVDPNLDAGPRHVPDEALGPVRGIAHATPPTRFAVTKTSPSLTWTSSLSLKVSGVPRPLTRARSYSVGLTPARRSSAAASWSLS